MYPFRRVVVSFTLCPALVGIFIFGHVATIGLVFENSEMNALEMIVASFGFGILSAATGMIFYGLPAFGLAMLYAYFQLRRCAQHMLIVCLAGGTGALMWGEVLPMETHHVGNFCLGAVTSLLMALYALPRQKPGS